jgi:phosphonate transport system permease protein
VSAVVQHTSPRPRRSWFVVCSICSVAAVVLGSWLWVTRDVGASSVPLFSAETVQNAKAFGEKLLGRGEAVPAYRDPKRWREAGVLALQTLAMSVLAIAFAAFGMLATVMVGARQAVEGERSWVGQGLSLLTRGSYILTRAVPELIWAMLIVFVFSPGIVAGALALGVHNYGVLGRLCAEGVENIDRRPVRAIRSTGAGSGQTLAYAVLPMLLPGFLTYILYRWEVIIRTTIVVGAVAAAGLGREFRLRMSFFHYSDVLLLLIVYVLLVFLVDGLSVFLRRLAR